MKKIIIRITTVPVSLDKLLEGQLRFMNSHYKVIAISSDKEYLDTIGIKEDVETFHVEMTRKITPIKDSIAVVKLYLFLKKTKPFIVHTHTPKAGIVGMLAATLAQVPHRLHTVAGLPLLEAKGLKRKVLDFVEKLTYSCATKVYPNSFGLLKIIEQNNYCAPNKLKVLANGSSNGINTAYFDSIHFLKQDKQLFKQKLQLKETDFVFVFVGRIVSDKGINELVAAFAKLQDTNANCKLLLIGPLEEDLDPLHPKTLQEINTNDSIISVGFQMDIRPYFAISNCLVFPSYREGFPNVVMQAGAMGLPSIVTDINGCNEIIIEEVNGIIIPVKNATVLSEAMKQIVFDTTLYQTLQLQARTRIVSNYEQHKVWEALLAEYKSFEKK